LIMQLLNIMQQISTKLIESGLQAMIINGRKLTESDIQETTIIDLLAKGMGRSEDEVFTSLNSLSNTLDKLSRPRLYRQEIDLNAIDWIRGLCSPSTISFVHISEKGSVSFSTKRITHLGYPDTPIKILDATGDASAASALVGRTLKTVRADVAWNSNRVHIKINTSRKVMLHSKESNLRKLLFEMLSHTQAKKNMVITYMRHEQQVLKILRIIEPSREFMGYHFIGPRGINSYQECDAVLVIGLPYPNLNSAAQDVCILFPDQMDSDKRMSWTEACMQWDFIQGIHRIRPVHKSKVDVILAASSWPSMLPAPDIVIDRSQNANWKKIAIKRLEPFVETFGFLNQDIGFLANVYVKSKAKKAKQFQENMAILINDVKDHIRELKDNCITSQLGCLEDINGGWSNHFEDKNELPLNEKFKLILALNNISWLCRKPK